MVNKLEQEENKEKTDEQIYEAFETHTFYNYEQIASYYADEIELAPELDAALKDYVYWSAIKRNVVQSFDEDDPKEIKKMVGTVVHGINVTEEMYKNSGFVYENYNKAYDNVKVILKDMSLHYSKYLRRKSVPLSKVSPTESLTVTPKESLTKSPAETLETSTKKTKKISAKKSSTKK